jgi:NitT/TauT family transport system substrate-binding protein
MSRLTRALVLAALVTAAGLACGPSSAPASKPAAGAAAPAGPPSAGGERAGPAPAQPPPVEQIKVPFASFSAVYTPFFIAMEKGYLAEEGLEMEIIHAGGGVATPALVSGEVQYSTSAASSVSAILTGAPLKVVYTNADRPGYELWSSVPEVRTLQDLVGKAIGIQTRGDTMDIAARMLLQQHGIDPNSVTYTAMGVGAARLASIEAGTVPAAVLGIGDVAELQGTGFRGHRIADIRKEVRMLYTGAAASDRELRERRDRAKRFLRATARGREYYRLYREESIDILGKYNDRSREANATDYDDVLIAMTDDGSMPVDAQQHDTLLRAEANGVPPVPVEQIYDYSVMQEATRELRASGYRPNR